MVMKRKIVTPTYVVRLGRVKIPHTYEELGDYYIYFLKSKSYLEKQISIGNLDLQLFLSFPFTVLHSSTAPLVLNLRIFFFPTPKESLDKYNDDIHINIPNDICISKLHTHCISHSYKCL